MDGENIQQREELPLTAVGHFCQRQDHLHANQDRLGSVCVTGGGLVGGGGGGLKGWGRGGVEGEEPWCIISLL